MNGLKGMHVLVIGAGFGGLSAAAHLSRAGARVTIVEKAKTVGGKAAPLAKDGFTFDAGPTLLTMPWILAETFVAAGADIATVGPMARLDPTCQFELPGGEEHVVSTDAAVTRASIARFSPEDAERWDGFMAECRDIWETTGEPYLEAPFEGFARYWPRVLRRGARAMTVGPRLGTLDEFARRHFRSAGMRAFVGHFAVYAGGTPTRTSAALAVIPYLEICLGAFYPRGGVHALAVALARGLERRGVRILTGVEVTAIDVDERARVTGARTFENGGAYGHRIDADAVVANVDPLVVTSRLLPRRWRNAAGAQRLARRTPSLSGFVWAFGLEGPPPTRAMHSMLFTRDFAGELRDVFERGKTADDPSVWVSVPSVIDPTRAPEGHTSVFTLLLAPATALTEDWEAETKRLRAAILARLERTWKCDLEPRIRAEAFVTPCDIARSGSADGATYGAAPHGPLAAFQRPRNRAPGVEGLYFAGGATHPGGGVPLAMQSGRFAAELIAREMQGRRPPHVDARYGNERLQ